MYIIGLDPANSIFNVTYEARIEGVIMFGKEVGVIHGLFDKYNQYFVTCFWLSIRLFTLFLVTNLKATIITKPLHIKKNDT